MQLINRIALFSVSAALAACGGGPADSALNGYSEAKLETEEDAKKWGRAGSAPNVQMAAFVPLLFSGLSGTGLSTTPDPNCPKVTKDGNTTRIEGGCTDKNGSVWSGKATQDSEAAGSRTGKVTYDDFSFTTKGECQGTAGTTTLKFQGFAETSGTEQELSFEMNLRVDVSGRDSATCAERAESSAYAYKGTQKSTGTRQTFNGSGRFGTSTDGVVQVETKDEVIDFSACSSEALSGSTSVKSGSNTIVLNYDGASKCDQDSRVPWTLNGEAKGELIGVNCAAASGSAMGAWSVIALIGTLTLRRRRSSRQV